MAPLTPFYISSSILILHMCGGLPGFSGGPLFLFFGQGAEIFVFLWAFFRNGYSKMTAFGAFLRQFAQEFFL